MADNELGNWIHEHTFNVNKQEIEKRTLLVVIITFVMMIAEILFGWLSNSMALLADGFHMGTHAFALGLSLFAYAMARKHAKNTNFTFGTWKIEILGAYSSALVLGIVVIGMVYTSVERIIHPLSIHYNEALFVAVIGLIVNLGSAFILNAGEFGAHKHHHGEDAAEDHEHNHACGPDSHHHDHSCRHNDLNLQSAYLHVLADALTSVFAIVALLGAKYLGFTRLDPLMGIVGAALIGRWAYTLLKDSAKILLDHETGSSLSSIIRQRMESDGDTKICDLHLWRVADKKYACIISLVTTKNYSVDDYRKRLEDVDGLAHTTIEINNCPIARNAP
jgi:cation diffusion facilitator family transporter